MESCTQRLSWGILTLAVIWLSACSPGGDPAMVDEDIYAILKEVEHEVYGTTSSFTIDTENSRKPIDQTTNASLKKISAKSGNVELGISDALEYAVNHSNAFQSQKEALYLSGLNLSDTKIQYEWDYQSTADAGSRRDPQGDTSLILGADQVVNKLFTTGGSIGLRLANDLVKYYSGRSDKSLGSVVSFNLFQPLLRGAGAEIAAENLTQSHRNVIYQMRDYDAFQQNFYREVVIEYFDILQRKQRVENEKNNLKARKENFEYLKARAIDRERPSEVEEAEQDVLQAEVRLVNVQSDYATSLDSFKVTLGMPAGMTLKLRDSELEKLEKAGLKSLNLTEQSAYQLALENRASLLNEVDQFEDSRRAVLIAADDLKVGLDFVADARLASNGNRWERLDLDDISAGVGFELDLPVNQKRERNGYRRSLIRFHSRARSLRQSHDELKNTIRLRLRQLQQFKKNYEIQLGALQLAEKRVVGDRLRLKAGNLLFRSLSESQDALIVAQNSVTVALVNYQESRLRLLEELGVLDIDKKEFWLKK